MLINGNCLDVMQSIESESIDCILTDPPYIYLKGQKLDKPFNEKTFFRHCKKKH